MANQSLMDNNLWQRTCFLVNTEKLPKLDRDHRFSSDARIKYADTTLGGSMAINPPSQFCRYADIKVSGILAGRPGAVDTPTYAAGFESYDSDGKVRSPVGSRGMGRQYAKMFDDTGEYITMRWGVAKHNPLLNFFNNFYDAEAAAVARTGKGTDFFFIGGRILGTVIGYAVAPALMAAKALFFFAGVKVSKYYYLDHKMHMYWTAVNNIANTIAVNQNIYPRVGGRGETKEEMEGRMDEIRAFNRALPDIFREEGGIDVMAVSTRYSRLSIKYQKRVNAIATNSSDLPDFLKTMAEWVRGAGLYTGGITDTQAMSIEEYIDEYLKDESNQLQAEQEDTATNSFALGEGDSANVAYYGFSEKAKTMAEAVFNDGNQFVTFRVNNTGPSTESFSNQAGESAAQSKYNGIVSSARDIRFSAGDFQTGVGIVDATLDSVKSLASGALTSVGVEGLGAFMGNAFVDMPQVWQSASAQLPKPSFTIELRSWSGSPIAKFQKLWIPVSMLLAGVMPISTGASSYTAPMLLEAYSKNRCSIKLGMIDSFTITRGVGNLGRNREGDPNGITIQFSILDLSSIVAMPITTESGPLNGFSQLVGKGIDGIYNKSKEVVTGEAGTSRSAQVAGAAIGNMGAFDDSSPFVDLMAVYGGLGLTEQVYTWQKYRLNLTRQVAAFDSWLSVGNAMNSLSGSTFGRIMSAVTRGTTTE